MRLLLCLSLALALFTVACKKSGENIKSDFSGNVNITMAESSETGKKALTLKCLTESIYPCSNYILDTRYTVSNNKIIINFIKVNTPQICLTAPWYASYSMILDNLSGNYDLEINAGDSKITGQLSITPDNYKITIPPNSRIKFTNTQLNKIPVNSIFGTIHYHQQATEPTVQKFIDSLQYYGAIAKTYQPGNYGLFEIDNNGQIKQTQDPGYYFTRYYIFNYPNSLADLQKLVARYGINYADKLLVTLNTGSGETFYSWTK